MITLRGIKEGTANEAEMALAMCSLFSREQLIGLLVVFAFCSLCEMRPKSLEWT